MNVVLRENVTGVRVIRAFNKEKYEEKRMRKSFEDYAGAAISANRLFAGLESVAPVSYTHLKRVCKKRHIMAKGTTRDNKKRYGQNIFEKLSPSEESQTV